MAWWTGKDHDRTRLVKWWADRFGKTLLTEITPEEICLKLKPNSSQATEIYKKPLAVPSSILDFAILQQKEDMVSEQYVDENLCKKVRSRQLNNKVVRYLSDEERSCLVRAAQSIGANVI